MSIALDSERVDRSNNDAFASYVSRIPNPMTMSFAAGGLSRDRPAFARVDADFPLPLGLGGSQA